MGMVGPWAIALALLPSGPLPALTGAERAGLVELYRATGGPTWTDRDKWLTEADACEWYGVWCDFEFTATGQAAVVVGLSLDRNHLTGALPPRLLEILPHLHILSVADNALGGAVPEEVLARWDAHTFEFDGRGNAFSNLVMRVSLRVDAGGTLCANDGDTHYSFEAAPSGAARFETVRCKPGTERETVCLVREGRVDGLERLARGLRTLSFQTLKPEYNAPFTATTHGEYVTTSAWFGDGKKWSLTTYDRQGPIQAWAIQSLFFGLLGGADWESESTRPSCSPRPKAGE